MWLSLFVYLLGTGVCSKCAKSDRSDFGKYTKQGNLNTCSMMQYNAFHYNTPTPHSIKIKFKINMIIKLITGALNALFSFRGTLHIYFNVLMRYFETFTVKLTESN